jgi:hypothetical protein
MILQAIMISKTRFIHVFAKYPSFVHNIHILSRSNHKLLVTNYERLNGVAKDIQDMDVHEFIIGDTDYTASSYDGLTVVIYVSSVQLQTFKHIYVCTMCIWYFDRNLDNLKKIND